MNDGINQKIKNIDLFIINSMPEVALSKTNPGPFIKKYPPIIADITRDIIDLFLVNLKFIFL